MPLSVRARPSGWLLRQVSDQRTHTYTQPPGDWVLSHQKEQTSRSLSNWGVWKYMLDDVPQSTPSPVSSIYSQHQRQPLYSIPPATISGSVVNSSTEQILTEHLLCIRHCCGQRDTAEFKMDETTDPVALTQGWGGDITNKQSTYIHLSTSMSLKNIYVHVCMCAWSLQSCPTLRPHGLCSPPGSSVHGTLQTRTRECIARPSSKGSSQPKDQAHVSCISCFGRWSLVLSCQGRPCMCTCA